MDGQHSEHELSEMENIPPAATLYAPPTHVEIALKVCGLSFAKIIITGATPEDAVEQQFTVPRRIIRSEDEVSSLSEESISIPPVSDPTNPSTRGDSKDCYALATPYPSILPASEAESAGAVMAPGPSAIIRSQPKLRRTTRVQSVASERDSAGIFKEIEPSTSIKSPPKTPRTTRAFSVPSEGNFKGAFVTFGTSTTIQSPPKPSRTSRACLAASEGDSTGALVSNGPSTSIQSPPKPPRTSRAYSAASEGDSTGALGQGPGETGPSTTIPSSPNAPQALQAYSGTSEGDATWVLLAFGPPPIIQAVPEPTHGTQADPAAPEGESTGSSKSGPTATPQPPLGN